MKKNIRYIKIISAIILYTFIVIACSDTYLGLEKIQTDTTNPGKVIVNKIVPRPGALEINFSLPKGDADVAQIVASYFTKEGKKMEFNVSRYSSSILVEGLMGTGEVTVELKSVDNSGNESEIVTVKGRPLASSVEIARESLNVEPTFGGVKIEWQNPEGNFLAIHVLTEDTTQIKGVISFIEDQSKIIYSRDTAMNKTFAYVRNYPDTEHKFGFVISDKWGNRSDTLTGYWTPYREDRIEYQHIEAMNVFNYTYHVGYRDYDLYGVDPVTGIQNDANFYASWASPATLFNNNTTSLAFYCYRFVKNLLDPDESTHNYISSAYCTYDLNVDTRLNRMKIFWRPDRYYQLNSVKRLRFWGTDDNNPNRFTQFPEGWTMIGEYEALDAEDNMHPTPEEEEFMANGIDFSISDDNINPNADPTAVFRYLRVEMLDVYGIGFHTYTMNEIQLWGQIQKKYYD